MILYNPSMSLDMRDFGIFIPIEADKHKMVYDALKTGVLRDIPEVLWLHGPEFFAEIARDDLLQVHSPDYVERLFSPDEVDKEVIAAYELYKVNDGVQRWNRSKLVRPLKDFVTQSLLTAAGTYTCGLTALELHNKGLRPSMSSLARSCPCKHGRDLAPFVNNGAGQTGFAFFLGGGNHHAQRDYGNGFCLINDVVVSLRRLQAEGRIRTAWVVDTDAHKGDGTAALTWGDSSIRTLSIHMERGWPLDAPEYDPKAVYDPSVSADFNLSFTPSDIDIGIPETGEADYVPRLAEGLSQLEALLPRPDMVLVVGGVDPYENDELLSADPLKLTKEALFERDMLVYNFLQERHIPTAWITAGGYGMYSWEIYVQFLAHIMPARIAGK